MEHETMSEAIGRAGGNIRHLQHQGSAKKGRPGNTREDRKDLLRESMRDLDPKEADFFASKEGTSIVRADTHLNVAMVNNGDGTFRRPDSIDEVLDYGDARIGKKNPLTGEDRVGNTGRPWKPTSFETTLIALHLPKTMCVEIQDYYEITDSKTGESVRDKDGDLLKRSRWVARDRDEAIEYFEKVAIEYYATKVLTGGIDAIHGYNINFDETTPHIQIMADTLAPNPKRPDQLRCDASRMWGEHRDVKELRKDKHGVTRPMMELKNNKMSRYQKGLREHAQSLGYPIETEVDEERHLSGSGKEEFSEAMDAKRVAVERLAEVWELHDEIQEQRQDLRIEATEVRKEKQIWVTEELPQLRRQAKKDGYKDAQEQVEKERAEERLEAQELRREAEAAKNRYQRESDRLRQLGQQIEEELQTAGPAPTPPTFDEIRKEILGAQSSLAMKYLRTIRYKDDSTGADRFDKFARHEYNQYLANNQRQYGTATGQNFEAWLSQTVATQERLLRERAIRIRQEPSPSTTDDFELGS